MANVTKKAAKEWYLKLRDKDAVANALGVTRKEARSLLAGATLPPEPDEIVALRKQLTGLTKRLKKAEGTALDVQAVRAEIFRISELNPKQPDWLTVEPRKSGSAPGVPTAHLSDLHLGEVVDPKEIGGVNEFNHQVAWNRVETFVQVLLDLCFSHMVNPNYPGLVLCLGGDNVTGRIHPELSATNDRTDLESINDAIQMLRWVIDTLLEYFPRSNGS